MLTSISTVVDDLNYPSSITSLNSSVYGFASKETMKYVMNHS
jgi:hypothetical protein